MAMPKFESVAEYDAHCSVEGRAALGVVRSLTAQLVKDPEERLSYGIPTLFVGGKRIVHMAAWAEHLALYPVPPSPPDDAGLVSNLEPYVKGKGTLHFPYAAGLPTAVLERVLRAHLIRAGQWPA